MISRLSLVATLGLVLASPAALAQTGTLDQLSPFTSEAGALGGQSASYNGSTSFLVWQAEVQAGIAGTLEGFELEFLGAATGSHIDVRVRLGGGWNTGPVVWSGSYDTTQTSYHSYFFDTTSANIVLNPGDLFVIEMQGNDTGMNIGGSYVPPPNPPLYPNFLYLLGPGCFADCGWRIGFHTYMLGGGLQLSVTGTCGAQMTAQVGGGTANGQAAVIYCLGPGGPIAIPGGRPCAGTMLDLNNTATLGGVVNLGPGGNGQLGPVNVPSGACGVVRVQALDLTSCATSNVVQL
ncbi:MAG: hypothetical protein EYC70_15405 [Planctomycetota bacterium]|nr:MAG: hypothetical protein EYC70_15405 [Planctomycetota bacterium]